VKQKTKQFRIGLVALLIISLHIVLCLYLFFAPAQFRVQSGMVGVYRQLVLLGPFFTESRIKSTRYLSIRYKNDNAWSSFRNLSQEHFAAYRSSPWRWDKLACIGYETDLALTLGRVAKGRPLDTIKNSSSFQELNGFLMQEFIPAHVDSVQVICHGITYLPTSQTFLSDTTFMFTYNPHTIVEAKK
jgi:hypothetical protein